MSAFTHARTLVVRLFTEDDGQDLVEYALLTGIVAVAAAIALPTRTALRDIYINWVGSVNDLWEPPAPSGGG